MNNNKKFNKSALSSLIILIIIGVASLLRHEAEPSTYQYDEGLIFGTIYHITYQHHENLKQEIEQELQRFDGSLSPFNKESVITKVNNNETVVCDTLFTNVFNRSLEICQETNGAFDPTISPLINAWGFGFSRRDSVTPALIDSLIQIVGIERVKLVNNQVVKEYPEMTLNFSAIAKGYACDVVANLLQTHGVENLLVEIGGEIVAKGENSKGEMWRVGINKPTLGASATSTDVEEIVALNSGGMATSGNYRNFYVKDNKRIAHTIDTQTGYPVQHSLLSVTVVAADCMSADAYATAFMVLGLEKSLAIVESTPHVEALFISAHNEESEQYTIDMSSGMNHYLAH